ncbi:MAG: ATPase, T2SS/T4P/T4SS family [Planctomycetota bacterium]
MTRKLLGTILRDRHIITEEQILEALDIQKTKQARIGEILVETGRATSLQVTEALAEQYEMPLVDPAAMTIPRDVLDAVPRDIAKEFTIIPVSRDDGAITIAMADPLDLGALDKLRFVINTEVRCVMADRKAIQGAITKHYGIEEDTVEDMLHELTDSEITYTANVVAIPDTVDIGDDAPVIKLVQMIITQALKARASDIHIEPMSDRIRIRFRIDGVCHEVDSPPKRLQNSITSRIKIMAHVQIEEKRRAQDGRILINVLGRQIDLRVSFIPHLHGESIVMRILDKESLLLGVQELGFHEDDYKRFQRIIKQPNGIFLVTGPTGSGKTTTLYAALNELNTADRKIVTAEDPVEYHLSGVNQCQVKREINLSFPRIIRAFLRQAPNIILVGEIRDAETASIAIESALTGHLVFSTLHTNDAPSAITRLIDIGVPPFLVSSSVQAVMAQRLVRKICDKCREPFEANPVLLKALGFSEETIATTPVYHGKGCPECRNTGFRGRVGIFELMDMTSQIREMAFNKAPTHLIRNQARVSGMVSLRQDGARKVIAGVTTPEEVLTTTSDD